MPWDVRSIANFVLDIAAEHNSDVTNLSINKIIYFLHVASLHEFRVPLVSAKIEAWDHGPVFREIYHQFKSFGRSPIREKARRLNVSTGEFAPATYEIDVEKEQFLRARCIELLCIPAGKLVDMSHVEDGPWHRARYGNGRINVGVEITDELILAAQTDLSRH